MKISFVIPAKNEQRLIMYCLHSIMRNAGIFDYYEIIIADNGSTDGTKNISPLYKKLPVIKIIDASDCKTIGQVRNKGAEFATGNYLIFIDADSEVNYDLLQETKRLIEYGVIAGGSLSYVDDSILAKFIVYCWNKYCIYNNIFTGYYTFIQRNVFESLGGYNPLLAIGEDVHLSKLLAAQHYKTRLHLIKKFKVKTSARKLHLYSFTEHLTFILNLLFNFKYTITQPSNCFIHYNIRR